MSEQKGKEGGRERSECVCSDEEFSFVLPNTNILQLHMCTFCASCTCIHVYVFHSMHPLVIYSIIITQCRVECIFSMLKVTGMIVFNLKYKNMAMSSKS